eukprot:m.45066 g.45066  ORF g.45066 m.45066 type:complete len:298 (+) comp13070_c0_seq3:671-1564(+)
MPYKCRNCNGGGRVNAGYFTAGTICSSCSGEGTVERQQRVCKRCSGRGAIDSRFGLTADVCPACDGTKYSLHAQLPCQRCHGQGQTAAGLGLWHRLCHVCDGAAYVAHRQHACKHCNGSGSVGWLGASMCPACKGKQLVAGKQYLCRACNAKGSRSSRVCSLCDGQCWLPYDQLPCPSCGGKGRISHWLSSDSCQPCQGVGYHPVKRLIVDAFESCSSSSEDQDTSFLERNLDQSYVTTAADHSDDGQLHLSNGYPLLPRSRQLPRSHCYRYYNATMVLFLAVALIIVLARVVISMN